MLPVETPKETLIRFDQNPRWRNEPVEVIAKDLLCSSNESNLSWNPACYEEVDGELFDPIRKRYVAGSAGSDIVEENVISQFREWFKSHDSGLAVSISPRGNGIRPYPEEQLTIYRIGYKFGSMQKVLFLTSHQFNHEFKNPEEIRRFIFTENDSEKSVFEIISWLKKISNKPVSDDLGDYEERRQKADIYARKYVSGTPMEYLVYQMDQTRFIGANPIGCPSSGSNSNISISGVFSYENATIAGVDQYGDLNFSCPSCGATNTRPHGQLISNCQHCGADVRC